MKRRKRRIPPRKLILEGTKLSYNASQQQKYIRAVRALLDKMTSVVKREVIKLFESRDAKKFYAAQRATDASIANEAKILMSLLTKRFDQLFGKKAKSIAEKMIEGSLKVSHSALYASFKKMSADVTLKTDFRTNGLNEILKASITENVSLIKTIASSYLGKVEQQVMRSITTGQGLKTLIPQLKKYEGISARHARNVALDQTRKVYSYINAERVKANGLEEFKWLHSGGGQRPRKSHRDMNGLIFRFDNLPIINQEQVDKGYEAPERGLPGQAIFCGCTMVPIYRFEDGTIA